MTTMSVLADGFLAEPIKQDVESGRLSLNDGLMAQVEINKRLAANRADIQDGQGVTADEAYFDRLRERL